MDATEIRTALEVHGEDSFEVESVGSCSEALALLAGVAAPRSAEVPAIAAVLLDLSLPDSQGLATFNRVFHTAPKVPILIFSSLWDEDDARLAVRNGAQDYLLRSHFDNYSLRKALRGTVDRAANAEAQLGDQERAQVTLNSIGDAVITTDARGRVTFLNEVAEAITGWSRLKAAGHPLADVFHIIDAHSRDVVPDPMALAVLEQRILALTPDCLLVRHDGVEIPIEDSTAPIHDSNGHVAGAVMVFHDSSKARMRSLQMSHLAGHDGLTDLPNRLLFNDRLTQAIRLALRHRLELAVLFLDVDGFKQVNDSLGHSIGDRLLQAVAQRLVASVRASDTVSRHGGDEFLILLSAVTNASDARISAGKILEALSRPYRIDGQDVSITVSIGIAACPRDATDAEKLMQRADAAMYRAKSHGRNNYQFYESDMAGGMASPPVGALAQPVQ